MFTPAITFLAPESYQGDVPDIWRFVPPVYGLIQSEWIISQDCIGQFVESTVFKKSVQPEPMLYIVVKSALYGRI